MRGNKKSCLAHPCERLLSSRRAAITYPGINHLPPRLIFNPAETIQTFLSKNKV